MPTRSLHAINSDVSFWDQRQTDNRPYSGSTAPTDLPRLNRQPKFRPAHIQSLERAFAFQPRELMTETEMDPCPEGNMAVGPSLKIELFGEHVCCRIQVGGYQHGHDLVAALEPDTAQLHVLPDEARCRELHRRDKPQELLDCQVGSIPILCQPVA